MFTKEEHVEIKQKDEIIQEEKYLEEEEIEETTNNSLVINNITIISRSEDNYINATQLCQAGGKKFYDWSRLDSTKELINTLIVKREFPLHN